MNERSATPSQNIWDQMLAQLGDTELDEARAWLAHHELAEAETCEGAIPSGVVTMLAFMRDAIAAMTPAERAAWSAAEVGGLRREQIVTGALDRSRS